MTISAEKNDVTKPTAKSGMSEGESACRFESKSYPVAANMVGIARKKENSTETLLSNPASSPPMIVAPERETPGKSEKH